MLLWLTVGLWTPETDAHQLITMGFVAPYSGRAGYTLTAPGATVAIERAKSEGLLNDIDIRYDRDPIENSRPTRSIVLLHCASKISLLCLAITLTYRKWN